MPPSRLWPEWTTTDLARADMSALTAVLPVAAVEQHGPHLPLGTDVFIMEGYLERVLAKLPAHVPAILLPTQTIGCSIEHGDFHGTLSLSARTAIAAWTEVAESVLRTGCRRIVVINSHGGNSSLVEIIARDLRARHGCLVVLASWQRFGYPDGLFSPEEVTLGIHGGEIETSLMLAFRPDLVRLSEARKFTSASEAMQRDFVWLRAGGRPTGFGWMAQDLSIAGPVGNAARADAARGEACAAHGVDAFVSLLGDVAAFDMARLKDGPLSL